VREQVKIPPQPRRDPSLWGKILKNRNIRVLEEVTGVGKCLHGVAHIRKRDQALLSRVHHLILEGRIPMEEEMDGLDQKIILKEY